MEDLFPLRGFHLYANVGIYYTYDNSNYKSVNG